MKDNWKIVYTSTLPQDIYLARSFLESEGIGTLLQDELTTQVHNFYSTAIGGAKLLVPDEHAEQATRLLREAGYIIPQGEQENTPVETFHTDDRSHCPYCRSSNIKKDKKGDPLMLVFYAFLGVLFPVFKPVYLCFDCQKRWKYRKP